VTPLELSPDDEISFEVIFRTMPLERVEIAGCARIG
jgi:hypothetical protein